MTWSKRLYLLRFSTGLVLALPIAVVVVWYAWSAFAAVDRYRRAVNPERPITLELFHIALHDELTRDVRRLLLPERPAPSTLPTYALSLTRENLDRLGGRGPAVEGASSYVKGLLRKDGEMHEVRVRYRGDQPWHFLGVQKSMKLRLDKGDLLDGVRTFNLINDPTPFGMEDQIILDLARESGLLAPEYRPAWVRLNNTDLGVFRYEAQPDEGLLRRSKRMPGSMYSGDSEGGTNVFAEPAAWSKVASRDDGSKEDRAELDALLTAVGSASHAEFAEYAARRFDLDRYARFDALDVVFGGNEHDYLSNHKLYVDPHTGRFEPVAWSFRGFQHEPMMNLVDSPLLVRLKMTPGYLARRDRAVYELINGAASVPAIRARVEAAFRSLLPELAADPHWDAYKLLPNTGERRFLRNMPRPMSAERWVRAAEAELAGHARRTRWIANELERSGIAATVAADGGLVIEAVAGAHAAYVLREVTIGGACTRPLVLSADVDLDGLRSAGDVTVATGRVDEALVPAAYAELYAGVVLVPREDVQTKRGAVRAEREPRTYRWFADAPGCTLERATLELENLVTGGTLRLAASAHDPSREAARGEAHADQRLGAGDQGSAGEPDAGALATAGSGGASSLEELVPWLVAGARSPHVWAFPARPAPEVVAFGPGVVRIVETRRFGAHQTVRIAAGTELALGPGASLLFEGPVFAEGTSRAPILVTRADPARAFGGIVLAGAGTAGSRLRSLRLRGGSRPAGYAASIELLATADVVVEDLRAEAIGGAEDVIHAGSVRGLALHEIVIEGAPIDGVDLELTQAELRGVRVIGAGDDCLDLGASEVRVRDGVLAACTNNAVSAGEESDVSLSGVLIAGAKIGLLAKNASEVRATRSLIFGAETALVTGAGERHYAGRSAIRAEELFALRCGAVREAAKGTTIEVGGVLTALPRAGVLDHLRTQVLGLPRWDDLDAHVQALIGGRG